MPSLVPSSQGLFHYEGIGIFHYGIVLGMKELEIKIPWDEGIRK